jgi:hypothetical protein
MNNHIINLGSLSKKEFLISMIRDHLLSYRLLQGLERIGFDTTNFNLYLAENIFALFGFGHSEDEERLFEAFLNWSKEALEIDFSITKPRDMDEFCKEIYHKLKQEKKSRKLKSR